MLLSKRGSERKTENHKLVDRYEKDPAEASAAVRHLSASCRRISIFLMIMGDSRLAMAAKAMLKKNVTFDSVPLPKRDDNLFVVMFQHQI